MGSPERATESSVPIVAVRPFESERRGRAPASGERAQVHPVPTGNRYWS